MSEPKSNPEYAQAKIRCGVRFKVISRTMARGTSRDRTKVDALTLKFEQSSSVNLEIVSKLKPKTSFDLVSLTDSKLVP